MDAQENVKAAKQFYADFKRGDIDSVLSALAEDVDWEFDTVATEVPQKCLGFGYGRGVRGCESSSAFWAGNDGKIMDDGKITNVREFVATPQPCWLRERG